jgi:uncharacterized membrane protein YagU involved in acid resistance
MDKLLAGAVGGIAATAPMTAVMVALQQASPAARAQSLPPKQITVELAERAGLGRELDGAREDAATTVSHFGYGGAVGALYPYASDVLPGPTLVKGALFGLGVWAASYLGWIPAAGILRTATREPAGRNAMMVASHLVWGAATAAISKRLLRGAAHERRSGRDRRAERDRRRGRDRRRRAEAEDTVAGIGAADGGRGWSTDGSGAAVGESR